METLDQLRRKINSAKDLMSVVKTMKVIAASSIGQYEKATESLSGYFKTIELGIHVYLRKNKILKPIGPASVEQKAYYIVFGSDQGLVGQFNEQVSDFTLSEMEKVTGKKVIWSVGERVYDRFIEQGKTPEKYFQLPNSVDAISRLITALLESIYEELEEGDMHDVYIIQNEIQRGSNASSIKNQLLPLKSSWHKSYTDIEWPTKKQPEVVGDSYDVLAALIREYLFVSIYRSCAESLASENMRRLIAMQHSEKNIENLLIELNGDYHRLRQGTIDEELFDVLAGFEALKKR